MESVESLLIVTRERPDDRRFGLGRSLDPVVAELHRRGVRVAYLSQEDAGSRGLAWLQRWRPGFARWLKRRFPGTDAQALAGGILERLNMGRLAAKVAFRDEISHVHCHDPIITAGFQWWRWWYGGLRARQVRHGLTQHGFGSYTQALHEDGAPLDAGAMAWLRRWEAGILRRADWVMTPTQAGRAQLARDLGVYPLPAHWQVVPHPRPALSFPPRNEARAQLAWDPDWFVVLGVGRDAPLKRFVDLIHACARINDERLRLVLLGPGESVALRRIAADAGLGARLILAASWEPAVYYAAADVYVSASETESFGLANVEALAAGLPAIVTAVGGVPEVVGNAAWLVPPRQPVLIADAITCLLRSPEERRAWSDRAQARMRQWPDAAAVAEGYLQVYRGAPVTPGLSRQLPLEMPVSKPLSVYPLPRRLEITARRLLVLAPHPETRLWGWEGCSPPPVPWVGRFGWWRSAPVRQAIPKAGLTNLRLISAAGNCVVRWRCWVSKTWSSGTNPTAIARILPDYGGVSGK
ncbi:L-malate glycosyltransferase [Methylomarinovum caldicuralii]|uniref:L-malate glycosyltransferase n=1 Tax=Methylomarinovum caldicuralii TaxID=438856 RepID=A0AAU9C4D5_9GAMM|nr:L-malate glycosyltransferase [Methylomarinovum caldicuralii]